MVAGTGGGRRLQRGLSCGRGPQALPRRCARGGAAPSLSGDEQPGLSSVWAPRSAGLSAIGAAVVWALAGWLIPFCYGPDYARAVPAFRVLLIAFPLMSLNYALTHQLIGWNRHRAYAVLCAGALAFNVALNARLIPELSIVGAAWTTVWTEVLLTAGCAALLWGGLPATRSIARRTGGGVHESAPGATRGAAAVGRRAGDRAKRALRFALRLSADAGAAPAVAHRVGDDTDRDSLDARAQPGASGGRRTAGRLLPRRRTRRSRRANGAGARPGAARFSNRTVFCSG